MTALHPNLDLVIDAHLRAAHAHLHDLLTALQAAGRMGDANGEDCFDAAEALDRLICIVHRRGATVEKLPDALDMPAASV